MPGGAEDVVAQDGLVGVDRIFALHCDPSLDVGQVGLRVGAITAAADQIEVTLTGRGGHTSRPHLTQDLTYALAKVVTDVPGVLSRRLDPRAGAALVWGAVHSGGAHNVIPSIGKVGGTLRMLDASVWEGVERLLEEVVHAVVAPYAVHAEVLITKGVPPVVNDAGCIESLTAAVTGSGAQVAPTPQSLGGEDFAWYLTHVAGAMARLGTRTPGGPTYDLHRGDLVVDEAAIGVGARTLAGAVFAAAASAAGSAGLGGVAPLSAVADR
jgi:amidohydrolase